MIDFWKTVLYIICIISFIAVLIIFVIFGAYEFFVGPEKAKRFLKSLPFSISYIGVLIIGILFIILLTASYILLKKIYGLM